MLGLNAEVECCRAFVLFEDNRQIKAKLCFNDLLWSLPKRYACCFLASDYITLPHLLCQHLLFLQLCGESDQGES